MALGAYFLAWPYASTAMLMAAVFCALASSSPRPIMMIRQVLTGFLIAMPLSLVCVYFVLVHGDGFPMLVLSFAPFLAVGLYLMTNPAKLGVGLGVSTFITQMAPTNVMHVDGAAFLNTGMALIVGLMLAALVFAVLLPEHTMGHKDHIGPALWREALHACTAPARRVKHRFDNRVRDLLSQLNAAAGPAPGVATRAVVRQALTLLEIGHSVIDLRELIASSSGNSAARDALQRCVDSIAAWLRTRGDSATAGGAGRHPAGGRRGARGPGCQWHGTGTGRAPADGAGRPAFDLHLITRPRGAWRRRPPCRVNSPCSEF